MTKKILLFGFVTLVLNSFAQKEETTFDGWSKQPFSRKAFIENKAQFDYNGVYPNDFDYVIDMGTKVFFKNNQLIYVIRDNHLEEWSEEELERAKKGEVADEEEEEREKEKFKPTYTTVTMNWIGANPNAKIMTKEEDKTAYLFPNFSVKSLGYAEAIRCKGYKKLIIKDLYNGVDAYYTFTDRNGGFKYALHVSPTADISQIKYQYLGDVKGIYKNSKGQLIIETLDGNIEEDAPYSYDKRSNQAVSSSFKIDEENIISFNVQNTSNGIVIDPWSRVPNYTPTIAVDIGRDSKGNVFATSGTYYLEKYDVNGNILFSMPVDTNAYYGDMLTNDDGFCFYNTAGIGTDHHATAVDSNGNRLWISTGINECWRFVQNECIGEVYSLVGVKHSNSGFAIIDATTGAVSGYTQTEYSECCEDPHSGAIDNNGDVYTIASGYTTGTNIYKWDPANNLVATYPFALGAFAYSNGYAGSGGLSQGYNGLALSGDMIYIHDGATLFVVDKNTGNLVDQMSVPAGDSSNCGGIYISPCGLIFIGSTNGIYMYDLNLNQLEYQMTNDPVYDIVYNNFDNTIAACGPNHVSSRTFTIPNCVFSTNPEVQHVCGTGTGYIKLNLSGGLPGYTYQWSGNGLNATTDSVGGLSPGTYKCVYTDSKCPIPNKDSIEITVLLTPSPTVTTTVTDVTCFGLQNGTASLAVSGGVSPYSVAWLPGYDANNDTLIGLTETDLDTGVYYISITDSINCTVNDTFEIIQPDSLILQDFVDYDHCASLTLQDTLRAQFAGGTAPYSFNWTSPTVTGLPDDSVVFFNLQATATVTLTVTDANNCVSNPEDVTITINPTPVPSFTVDSVCFGTASQFVDGTTISSGTITNRDWTIDQQAFTGTNPTYTFPDEGTHSVLLVATSDNGCIDSIRQDAFVQFTPIPFFTVNDGCQFDDLIQFNNLTTVNGAPYNAGFSFSWDFQNGIISTLANPSIYYDTAGTFGVVLSTISDDNCAADTTISVTIHPKPNAGFEVTTVCVGFPTNFTDTSSLTSGTINQWLWNIDNTSPNTPNPIYTYNTSGSYPIQLTVVTDQNCTDVATGTAQVNPNPVVDFTTSKKVINVLDNRVDFNNLTSGATAYYWYFDTLGTSTDQDPSFTFDPIEPCKTYENTLIAVTSLGCVDSIIKTITSEGKLLFYVPNAFTPDADGLNDVFKPEFTDLDDGDYLFEIFTRWGERLFFTNNVNEGWDGTFEGTLAKQDVYVYKVTVNALCSNNKNEKDKVIRGHFTLIK